MRVAVGGIMHESNTFNPTPTPFEAFRVQRGEELPRWWRDTPHELGGFIAGAERFGYELVPTLMAQATPGGMVTREAFERLTQELLERLSRAPGLDGLLLALHGAMVGEDCPDADEVAVAVRGVRERLIPGLARRAQVRAQRTGGPRRVRGGLHAAGVHLGEGPELREDVGELASHDLGLLGRHPDPGQPGDVLYVLSRQFHGSGGGGRP